MKAVVRQEKISRFFRFIVVGGTVAFVDLGLVWLLGHVLPPVEAVSLAYFTAVGCHFTLNKFWVFQCNRSDYLKQIFQYGVMVFFSWLTTIIVVQISLRTITNELIVAKLLAVPPAAIVAFLCMRLFVFRAASPTN
jgi:putative flippase GtrA